MREHNYRLTPARRMLVQRTIDNVVAVDRRMIDKAFHFNISLSLSRSWQIVV